MASLEKKYIELEDVEQLDEEEIETKPNNSILEKEGKYYWIAELPMLKSFFLLFEVWKVLGLSALIVCIFLLVLGLINGDGWYSFVGALGSLGIVLGILFVLSIPAYYIVARANYGKYTVLFEMDEEGIDHIQIKTEKAKALDKLTALCGLATGNFAAAGRGLLNMSGSSLYSKFDKVRKIKANKEKNIIKLNNLFLRNQIYTDDENYDFIYDYIKEHAINAKEK